MTSKATKSILFALLAVAAITSLSTASLVASAEQTGTTIDDFKDEVREWHNDVSDEKKPQEQKIRELKSDYDGLFREYI